MNYKLLIIPGYLVGIGSLFIISYRTIIAFFNDSKSVTIHVNRFGEHYADLVFLVIIWIICLIGLLYLYLFLKEEGVAKMLDDGIRGRRVISKDGSYLGILKNSLIDEDTGVVSSFIVEPSEEVDTKSHRLDDSGNLVVSFDSIKLVKDEIVLRK